MKLSEIWDAINNGAIVDDLGDNKELLIMIQDSTNLSGVKERGIIQGDNELMAKMIADRMVKDEEFRDMIHFACIYCMGVLLYLKDPENKSS